uniref:Uncharacterized protein n=1 Tax=Oryza punctata TaxID=4537 RepID=A0A0E0JEF9_ORYPU
MEKQGDKIWSTEIVVDSPPGQVGRLPGLHAIRINSSFWGSTDTVTASRSGAWLGGDGDGASGAGGCVQKEGKDGGGNGITGCEGKGEGWLAD